jgi:hypothetical protein
VFGVVMVGVGAGAALALALTGAGPLWGIALFLPFWLGATGIIQAREKT